MVNGESIEIAVVGLLAVMATLHVGVLAFLWNLSRDVRSLSERVARIEGVLEGQRHQSVGG